MEVRRDGGYVVWAYKMVLVAALRPSEGCRRLARAVGCGTLFVVTTLNYLLEALGEWVDSGYLRREDVLVVVCRATGDEGGYRATEHRFDERGVLGDGWPVGFLLPDCLPGCAPQC